MSELKGESFCIDRKPPIQIARTINQAEFTPNTQPLEGADPFNYGLETRAGTDPSSSFELLWVIAIELELCSGTSKFDLEPERASGFASNLLMS